MPRISDVDFQPFKPSADPYAEASAGPAPTFGQTVSSAFRLENDVYNANEFLNRKTNPPDMSFTPQKLEDTLKQRGMWEQSDKFISARSVADVDAISQRLVKEQIDQVIQARSGWTGFFARMAAGLLSPTVLIPVGGESATVAEAFAKVGASAAAGAGIQESVLRANQAGRDPNQMYMSIGSSILMGGLLGGITHTLTKAQLDKMSVDMAHAPSRTAISPPVPFGSIGAAYADEGNAGKLFSERGTKLALDQLSKTNAVTRGIQQAHAPDFMPEGSEIWRSATGKFSQAGLKLEDNVATTVMKDGEEVMMGGKAARAGGNVEDTIKTYAGPLDANARRIEDAYIEYVTNKTKSGVFALGRAQIAGALDKNLMSWDDFKTAASLAQVSDEAVHPAVRKAAQAIDDHLQGLYKDGTDAGTYTGKEKPPGGDIRYLSHLWDKLAIKSDTAGFLKLMEENYKGKIQADWAKSLDKLKGRQAKLQTKIGEMELSPLKVQVLKESYHNMLDDLRANAPDHVEKSLKEISDAKKELKSLGETGSPAAKALLQKVADANVRGGEDLKTYRASQKEARGHLANLNQAHSIKDISYRRMMSNLEANAQAQSGTIVRAAKQLQKLLNLKGTPAMIKRELKKAADAFGEGSKRFAKNEERIIKAVREKDPKLADKMEKQYKAADRMAKIEKRLNTIKKFDREAFAKEVDSIALDLAEVHAEVNARRVQRATALEARAEKYSPEELALQMKAQKDKLAGMGDAFERRYETKYNGVKINMKTGEADFSEHAKELAEYTTRKLLGVDRRLAYNDLIKDKRGIEMQRMINIGFKEAQNFLEKDPIKIMTHASRTLGADNTMRRVFGSADMIETFDKLGTERIKVLENIPNLKDTKDAPISVEKQAKYSREVNTFYDNAKKDLEVLLERAKGIRGIPDDPEAMSTRMGELALQLNSMRYLGGAMLASLSDPARIVQRHGLVNTFRHGFIPFITAFKDLRLSQLEGRMAGTANDTVSHSRLHQLNDVFDTTARGTALERGVRFASTKVGLMSGLDQWTQAWKQVTAGVANVKLLQSIAIVNGEKTSAKELDKAVSYLAQRNIDGTIASTIWKEVIESGGGDKLNGVWLPNTDKWDVSKPEVMAAQRAYRAALAGEIDHTIITPGMEKPNWIDSGMLGRLAGQFRSFSLSSTQKTVMAGLQEHDMAYVNGMMISLALGALSYYTYATAAGGDTEKKMLKSIDDGDWRLWADEAISRSGQTAIFDSAQRVTSHISGLSSYTTFHGGPITKQTGAGLFSDIVGPTGDLLKTGTAVVSGLRNPDRKQLHNMRTLMPYQNLFYFRQLLDQVENAAGDEFGLTGKRR